MEKGNKRGNFTGSIGFVLAAAGSAVGLGNIWRFPYLAAKDGGGTFILVYIILAPLCMTDEQMEAGLKIFEDAIIENL